MGARLRFDPTIRIDLLALVVLATSLVWLGADMRTLVAVDARLVLFERNLERLADRVQACEQRAGADTVLTFQLHTGEFLAGNDRAKARRTRGTISMAGSVRITPPSEVIRPPSKAAHGFARAAAGRPNAKGISSLVAGLSGLAPGTVNLDHR